MNIPKDYLCPITLEIMDLPVILIEDGRSYEKRELQRWLANHNTSPTTNKVLTSKQFIVNINLKNAIEEFREKQAKAQHFEILSDTLEIKSGRLPEQHRDKNHPQLRIKICVLGDACVGKTTIIKHLQFNNRIPKEVYAATVGPDVVTLHLNRLYEDRFAVSINIFDIPGDISQKDVWKSQYKCHGAVLVCDVTRRDTLKTLETEWYGALKQYGLHGSESVVLCNKIDLSTDSEDQIFKDAERFSTKYDLSLFYTSALTGKNVQTMFNQLVLCILNNSVLLNRLKENRDVDKVNASSRNEPTIILGPGTITLSEKTKVNGNKKIKKVQTKSSCC